MAIEDLPADAKWRAALVAVRNAARKVEENCRSPVKVGIVGEFSAGKTLLLGSLIGYTDALPVSEIPTTGNVTALNIAVVEELTSTKIGPYRVQFLDNDGFRQCLAFILEEAIKRAKTAELRDDLIDQLKAINLASNEVLSRTETWAKAAWRASNNPALRYLVRELVVFVRAYARYGPVLCEHGDLIEVEADVVRHGLELASSPEGIQSLDFDNIPCPTRSVTTRPDRLTEDLLREAFPLIRLVTVEVAVSRQIWNLSGLEGVKHFCLMDFPGLGSAESGVRDLFLCLRELEQIQTILILLNGKRPGGSEGSRIYDLMQERRSGQDIRDMILVAVGRFDELPLQNDGGEAKLAKLAGVSESVRSTAKTSYFGDDEDDTPAPSKLTTEDVYRELPVLKTCVTGAESLVPPGRTDRIVLVSPLLHLHFLQEKNPSLRVGSEQFLGKNRTVIDKAATIANMWGQLAKRLSASTNGSVTKGLVQWLQSFATDGGIGQLRSVIQSLVKGHGLLQKEKDVERDVEFLRQALLTLQQDLPRETTTDAFISEDQLQAIEKELRALIDLYNKACHKIESHSFTITRGGLSLPVEEILLEEIVFRVCEWQEWDSLLQRSRDGYIVNSSDVNQGGIFVDEDDTDVASNPIPNRSDDFYGSFVNTVEDLKVLTGQLINDCINEWLESLRKEAEPAYSLLASNLERKTLSSDIKALRLGDRATGIVIMSYVQLSTPYA